MVTDVGFLIYVTNSLPLSPLSNVPFVNARLNQYRRGPQTISLTSGPLTPAGI